MMLNVFLVIVRLFSVQNNDLLHRSRELLYYLEALD